MFRCALELLPTNATAEYLLGCCNLELKNHEEALKNLQRSAVLDPDFKHAFVALGFAYLHLNDFGAALRASEACLRRHPDSPSAEFNAGQAIVQPLFEPFWRP